MGQISLQIPQVGLSDSTEDPKVAANITTLQTLVNGQLDDTNLASPNNAYRRAMLSAFDLITSGLAGANDYLLTSSGFGPLLSNQDITTATAAMVTVPMWLGDAGYSSQPQDFQVANKTAYCRVRAHLLVNGVAPGTTTITVGLYRITGSGGTGTGGNLHYTFGSALAGSTVAQANPSSGTTYGLESGQFAVPTNNNAFALGFRLSAPISSLSVIAIGAQLYGYSA